MIFKSSGRLSSRQIPQTQSLVPRSRQSKVAIRRQDNIRDEMRVTIQTLLSVAEVVLLAGQLPDNQSLICTNYKTAIRNMTDQKILTVSIHHHGIQLQIEEITNNFICPYLFDHQHVTKRIFKASKNVASQPDGKYSAKPYLGMPTRSCRETWGWWQFG